MPDPVNAVQVPLGPCTPGFTQVYATTCNASGEAYGSPDWADPNEINNLAFVAPESAKKTRCGCRGATPAAQPDGTAAIIAAAAAAFKDGLETGLRLQHRPDSTPAVEAQTATPPNRHEATTTGPPT